MNEFVFTYPTKVYFGQNSLEKALRAELNRHGKTVMLAYGGASLKKNGIYDRVKELLAKDGKEVVDFPGIMPNPTYAKVQEGAALAKEKGVDFILAVGGGSVIDCCKIIAAQAKTDKDIWEMEFSEGKFPTEYLPMGAVVTASGTGAEQNCGAVITNEEKGIKTGVFGAYASFAVLDPELTASVPAMQVISGAFDTLSHAMETYLGNSDQDNVSDDVALAVMRNTVVNMRRLLEDVNDMQARSNLMWDSAMAENGILKAGRVTDFQAHQIEHQLGAQEAVDVAKLIEPEKGRVTALVPADLIYYIRQYSTNIELPYGREMLIARWDYHHAMYEAMEKAEIIDTEEFVRLAREYPCHYVVLERDRQIEEPLTEYGYELYAEVGEYLIYQDRETETP